MKLAGAISCCFSGLISLKLIDELNAHNELIE